MTEQWQELKETIAELRDNDGTGTQQEVCKFLANYMDNLEKQMQEPKWIPVKIRLLTEEEKEEIGYEYDYIYDCPLPDNYQDVLITTPYGVQTTTFYTDYGCYFESYEDEGDVIAWMPLPEPYKAESEDKE